MMEKVSRMLLGVVAAVIIGTGVRAYADTFTFNFNSLADGDSNGSIETYMNGVLGSFGTVDVTGARAEKNYNGDNHVVGPVSGSTVTSLTLGNSDGGVQHGGALDTFIHNQSTTDRIVMVFDFTIFEVSFDFEIFPDASCSDAPNSFPGEGSYSCSAWPDFTFEADDNVVFSVLGLDPAHTDYLDDGGVYRYSPFSGASSNERAPQLLAESGLCTFPGGVTKLEFIDWPTRIGVDNLVITTPNGQTSAPEFSGSFLGLPNFGWMAGLGASMLGLVRIRRKATRA